MRFKVDENLHVDAANLLRQHGHDALTVFEQTLQGKGDQDIAAVCQLERRVIVTLDLDFADVRAFPPAKYFGIIVFRLTDQSRRSVLNVLSRTISSLNVEPLVGRLWIVDESKIRIRAG